MENMKILSRESDEDISDDDAFVYNGDNGFTFKKKILVKFFSKMECSICIQPCLRNQTAVGDLIQTHCNHIFHTNCLDKWNYSGQATATACPNCRTELIAFFIDETDNGNIIEANTLIPNGSHI